MDSIAKLICPWTDSSIDNLCLSMKNSYDSCISNKALFERERKSFFMKWKAIELLNDFAKEYALNYCYSKENNRFKYSAIFDEIIENYCESKESINDIGLLEDCYFIQKIIDYELFDAYEYFYNHF